MLFRSEHQPEPVVGKRAGRRGLVVFRRDQQGQLALQLALNNLRRDAAASPGGQGLDVSVLDRFLGGVDVTGYNPTQWTRAATSHGALWLRATSSGGARTGRAAPAIERKPVPDQRRNDFASRRASTAAAARSSGKR